MNNQFKKGLDTQEEDLQELEELEIPKEPLKEGSTTAFFRKLFVEGVVTKESATGMFPFIVFLCFLFIRSKRQQKGNFGACFNAWGLPDLLLEYSLHKSCKIWQYYFNARKKLYSWTMCKWLLS